MLETARLTLRKPTAEDWELMHTMTAPEEVSQYLGGQESDGQAFERMLRGIGCWTLYGFGPMAVYERDGGAFVGSCGIFRRGRDLGSAFDPYPEAGWIVARPHWGKGYASEAMEAVIKWGMGELGMTRIVAIIDPDNAASLRIAEKLGFAEIDRVDYKGETTIRLALER